MEELNYIGMTARFTIKVSETVKTPKKNRLGFSDYKEKGSPTWKEIEAEVKEQISQNGTTRLKFNIPVHGFYSMLRSDVKIKGIDY